jgi:hypothetical protein
MCLSTENFFKDVLIINLAQNFIFNQFILLMSIIGNALTDNHISFIDPYEEIESFNLYVDEGMDFQTLLMLLQPTTYIKSEERPDQQEIKIINSSQIGLIV